MLYFVLGCSVGQQTQRPAVVYVIILIGEENQLNVHLCLDLGEASLVLGQHVGCTGDTIEYSCTQKKIKVM
jgi:hypothetical protein